MEGCLQFGSFLGSPLAAVAEEVQSFKVLKTSAAVLRERTEEVKEMLVPSSELLGLHCAAAAAVRRPGLSRRSSRSRCTSLLHR